MQSEILYNRLVNQDFVLDYDESLTSNNVNITLWEDGDLEIQAKNDPTLIYYLTAESISNYTPIAVNEISLKYDDVETLFIQFL